MTLEGDGERSNEQTKKRWKSVDEEERERRAYRVASERASERARLGGRTSVRIDRQNARWCGQKFRVTSKRRGYEHLLAEINKRRSGPPCRRDLLEAHATWRRYLLPSDGSLPQNTPPGLTLLGELGSSDYISCTRYVKIAGKRKVPTCSFGPILTPCTTTATTKRTTSFVS